MNNEPHDHVKDFLGSVIANAISAFSAPEQGPSVDDEDFFDQIKNAYTLGETQLVKFKDVNGVEREFLVPFEWLRAAIHGLNEAGRAIADGEVLWHSPEGGGHDLSSPENQELAHLHSIHYAQTFYGLEAKQVTIKGRGEFLVFENEEGDEFLVPYAEVITFVVALSVADEFMRPKSLELDQES